MQRAKFWQSTETRETQKRKTNTEYSPQYSEHFNIIRRQSRQSHYIEFPYGTYHISYMTILRPSSFVMCVI